MFGVKSKHTEGDSRVAQALDELKIRYEIDNQGDFKIGINLEDERSQLGFIRSNTYEFAGVELREIFSAALTSSGPFDSRTANLLLEENSHVKVGAWEVNQSADDDSAIFTAKVGAELGGDELRSVILGVLRTADAMEKRLSGRDDF